MGEVRELDGGPLDLMLGGACDGRWRPRVAIPMLMQAPGVTYVNPEVPQDQWEESMIATEERAKREASFVLWVITELARATASLVEVSRFIYGLKPGQHLVLVMGPDVTEGTIIEDTAVHGRDLKDMNRARAYVRDMVRIRFVESGRDGQMSVFWVQPGSDNPGVYQTTNDAIEAAMRYILGQLA